MTGPDALPAAVGALAAAIAQGQTAEDIALLSALFVQLGDSLALIAAARAQAETNVRTCIAEGN